MYFLLAGIAIGMISTALYYDKRNTQLELRVQSMNAENSKLRRDINAIRNERDSLHAQLRPHPTMPNSKPPTVPEQRSGYPWD